MDRFLIQIPYTPDEQLDIMDRMRAESTDLLCMTYWGEMDGQPSGWLVLLADTEEEARGMLPESLRSQARISKVQLLSPEDVEEMHRLAQAA